MPISVAARSKAGVGNLRHVCQSAARGTIFNSTFSKLKQSNYDLKKKLNGLTIL
jgi:hypothetical protein